MKIDKNIHSGEKIELMIDSDSGYHRYFSRIEEVIDDKTFIITRPVGERNFAFLFEGQTLKVIYFREDSAYAFDAVVKEKMNQEEKLTATINAVSEIYKLQRRNYFRLAVMVPILLTFETGGKKVSKKLYTSDISGGGIRIASKDKIDEGTAVEIEVFIPGAEGQIIKGRIVRCMRSEKDLNLFDIGIEFTEINPRIRQVIVRYVFSKQRELISKGLK